MAGQYYKYGGASRVGKMRFKKGFGFRRFLVALIFILIVVGVFFLTSFLVKGCGTRTAEHKEFQEMLVNAQYEEAKTYMDKTIAQTEVNKREKMSKGFTDVLHGFLSDYQKWAGSEDYSDAEFQSKYSGFDIFYTSIEGKLNEMGNTIVSDYAQGSKTYDVSVNAANRVLAFASAEKIKTGTVSRLDGVKTSIEQFNAGTKSLESQDYKGALAAFVKVTSPDTELTQQAKAKIAEMINTYYQPEMTQIKKLYNAKDYNSAYQRLKALSELFPDQEEAKSLLPTYQQAASSVTLKNWTGPIEHVFTHCLIAFPELGFAHGGSYDVDCIDVKEYKAILQSMYDKGYVLVRPSDVWEVGRDADGVEKVKRKQLMLPEGKKPVIFSIDDMVYDEKKQGQGMVGKLIIHDGKIQTYTKMADGREIISDDNECIPILDKFVEQHPDFSYNGAKLTLALTGFQGILGYRTYRESPNRESEIEAVKPIIQMLKDTGYEFASHSYKHGRMSTMSLENFKDDTAKWENEVETLLGPVQTFIYPFGGYQDQYNTINDKVKDLYNAGFRIFCGVGGNCFNASIYGGKAIFMDRANFDGYALRNRATSYARFFDTYAVYDHDARVVPYSKKD